MHTHTFTHSQVTQCTGHTHAHNLHSFQCGQFVETDVNVLQVGLTEKVIMTEDDNTLINAHHVGYILHVCELIEAEHQPGKGRDGGR